MQIMAMKILIIEDEPGIMAFLKQGLEEEGFEAATAGTGELGLEMVATCKPDLILLDWMLPGLSGLEVCHALRTTNQKTPVIFLTAKDTLQETIDGLRAGANDYIKKPFHFEELLERIRIQFRSSETPVKMEFGQLVIWPSMHKVTVGKDEVAFTHREFELLIYLAKNQGNICSRKDIIENVWDIHFDYDTSVIDVFVNAIRRKLKPYAKDNLIRTIRGTGYAIES